MLTIAEQIDSVSENVDMIQHTINNSLAKVATNIKTLDGSEGMFTLEQLQWIQKNVTQPISCQTARTKAVLLGNV